MNFIQRLTLIAAGFSILSCSSPTLEYIGYRMFPDDTPTKGETEIEIAGLRNEIRIYFDDYGIPHISADNERDLFYAFGYIQARDRRFQMETLKLLAAGRIRELVGDKDPTGLLSHLEIFSRMTGLYLDGQKMLAQAPADDRELISAFSEGVNAATGIEPRALEFRLLDYTPEPWAPEDTANIMAMIAFGLCKNWEHELARIEFYVHQLRSGSTIDRAQDIWPVRYSLPPHLVGDPALNDPFADISPISPDLVSFLTEYTRDVMGPAAIDQPWPPEKAAAGNPIAEAVEAGGSRSNNWAVSGGWTRTGKGALSSDPHMPHALPPLGYLIHIKCSDCSIGSYDAIGGGFVGLPAIAFGTNGSVAWGATSNWADVTDLYVEKPVPGKEGYYYYKGEEKAYETRVEVFKIRQEDGSLKEETLTVRSSVHGVLVNDFVARLPKDFPPVALKRVYNIGRPITALRDLYRSRDVLEAKEALYQFTAMNGHWVLTDDQGSVGYYGSILLPKRTTHLGTVPVPGWNGEYEWGDFVPPEELPALINPPGGFVGSANNQVVDPTSFKWPLNFEGDIPHRYMRISDVLGKGSTSGLIVEQTAALELDGIDLGFQELRPMYLGALNELQKDGDELTAQAAAILLDWDGATDPDSAAPSIFNTLNALLVKKILSDETSAEGMKFVLSHFNMEPFVYNLLGHPENPAWDDRRTEEKEFSHEVIKQTFAEAVTGLADRYGPDIAGWSWTKVAPFVLKHAFGGQKSLAKYLNRGPFPTLGTGNTLNKHQFQRVGLNEFPIKYGPVLRVNVDLNDLQNSRMSLPGGESGRPSSNHYDDMIELYLEGKGASMDMNFNRIKTNAAGVLILEPKKRRAPR